MQLSLYSTLGADHNGGPGTLLYTSSPVSLVKATAGQPLNYVLDTGVNVLVPDDVIWTAKFGGLEANEQAGLVFYNSANMVGSSFNDFWMLGANGQWQSAVSPPNVANFGAQIIAVPEPTTIQLGLLGGMAVLGMFGYRRMGK
jgi:hypothetical protein